MPEPAFWMVLNEQTGYTSYRHESFDSAYNEALRLANLIQGVKFHVLRCCGHHLVEKPTTWTQRAGAGPDDQDLPF